MTTGPTASGARAHHLEPDAPAPLCPAPAEPAASAGSSGKQRLRWTPELHTKFVAAVNRLGGAAQATPKQIAALMCEPSITLFHLKSHLQKYRLALAEGGPAVADSMPSPGAARGRKRAATGERARATGATACVEGKMQWCPPRDGLGRPSHAALTPDGCHPLSAAVASSAQRMLLPDDGQAAEPRARRPPAKRTRSAPIPAAARPQKNDALQLVGAYLAAHPLPLEGNSAASPPPALPGAQVEGDSSRQTRQLEEALAIQVKMQSQLSATLNVRARAGSGAGAERGGWGGCAGSVVGEAAPCTQAPDLPRSRVFPRPLQAQRELQMQLEAHGRYIEALLRGDAAVVPPAAATASEPPRSAPDRPSPPACAPSPRSSSA